MTTASPTSTTAPVPRCDPAQHDWTEWMPPPEGLVEELRCCQRCDLIVGRDPADPPHEITQPAPPGHSQPVTRPPTTVAVQRLLDAGRPARRAAAIVTAMAIVTAAVPAALLRAGASPPPNTSAAVRAAQSQKNAADQAVNKLTSAVTAARAAIAAAHVREQHAEQQYAYQRQLLAAAATTERQARTTEQRTAADVTRVRSQFRVMVRQQYMDGGPDSVSLLLAAPDPGALIQGSGLLTQVTDHQADVVAALRAALAAQAAAEAAARSALHARTAATTAADHAAAQARQADAAAHAAEAAVAARLAAARQQQQTAAAALTLAQTEQRAAAQAAAEQAALAADYQSAAVLARSAPTAPASPTWTPGMAATATARALRWLGMPYTFAGGNAAGPTYGVAVDYDSRNDGHVYGFDCSGLSLYAWAPYLTMAHYAPTQYSQAGHLHPDVAHLLPGDLVFWSENGQASGIGHVAIYVGDGNVIQAPHSGDHVRITPLMSVEPGFFGATRPLS